MAVMKELDHTMLRNDCDPAQFPFKDTSAINLMTCIIGQDRAVNSMEFGLRVKTNGYNIYMAGPTGTGKTSYARNYLKSIAASEKIPDDWCYVYNFDRPNQPMAISLPPGTGKVFQKDMEEFVKVMRSEISKAFESEDYERDKNEMLKEFGVRRNELMEKLNEDAERQGFKVRTTNSGIFFLPVIGGKTISEQEYSELDEELKHEISEKSSIMQMETTEIMRKIKGIEKDAENKVSDWENRIALFAVGMHISDLKEKFSGFEKVKIWLDKVQDDILQNLDEFRGREAASAEEQPQVMLPWMRRNTDSQAQKYKVNLLVDNGETVGAPVIVDFNPTFYNLLGRFEYENELGTMTTDFTMIKSGLFHQANGGYLVLQARDVLSNVQSWEALKRMLKTRQVAIETMREQMGLVALSTLKPEPIPADIKVILVGSSHLYQLLYQYDEDFKKLFRIKADFDESMDRNEDNILKMAGFVNSFCNKEGMPHFDRTAVAKVVDYSSRLVEDQNKISTRFNDIVEILSEASAWAGFEHSRLVTAEHVKKAIDEKVARSSKYDEKLMDLMEKGIIMIDTSGEVAGQINGLSIIDVGDYYFGKPSRITAATYMGESGIVNIEREIAMSGTSHSKGILILNGYIGQKYAQEMPLSLSASLCFEQLYSGVDGDSASSAELYALLSSLSEVPIKQCLAVTGSVNQRGEVQPIGGVSYKIEGFFELCESRGLDGSHGVVIPHQNVRNLVLKDDVVEAVKEGKFHIYPVRTIDEGIGILTGVEAGEKRKDGTYPKGTINYLVYEKLRKFAKTVASFGREENRKV